jgi:hypothetical protein
VVEVRAQLRRSVSAEVTVPVVGAGPRTRVTTEVHAFVAAPVLDARVDPLCQARVRQHPLLD